MKRSLFTIFAGIIFLSSCANILYLFPLSKEFRNGAMRASVNNVPDEAPAYLQAAENVIGYQFSLILICLSCSLILLCLALKGNKQHGK